MRSPKTPRLGLPLLVLAALALLAALGAGPARARPQDKTLKRVGTTLPAPGAPFVVEAKGTLGGAGRDALRVERRLLVVPTPDGKGLVARPTALHVKGEAAWIQVGYAGRGRRESHEQARAFYGVEGPMHAALFTPLAWLRAGIDVEAEGLAIGYPTADGGLRPVVGAWPQDEAPVGGAEIEDPYLFFLHAPPEVDLLAALPRAARRWDPNQTSTRTVELAAAAGGGSLEQTSTLLYVGLSKERALFELEVVTTGAPFADHPGWRIERRSVGSVLVQADGHVLHAKIDTTAKGFEGGEDAARTVVASTEVKTVESGLDAAALAAVEAEAKAWGAADLLRRTDPDAFRRALLDETSAIARDGVAAARPGVDLEGVSVRLDDASGDAPGDLDVDLGLALLERHGPALERLGLLPGGDRATLAQAIRACADDRVGVHPEGEAGIVVSGFAADRIDALTKAWARLAASRARDVDPDRIGPDGTWEDSAAFIDLDATLSAIALRLAAADALTELTLRGLAGPLALRLGLRMLAARPRPEADPASLPERCADQAHAGALAFLARHLEDGDAFQDVNARAWAAFPYRTLALLGPRADVPPSTLVARGRAQAAAGAVGATRAGALLLAWRIHAAGGAEAEKAFLDAFVDDVIVSYPSGVLWVVRFTDEAAARAFSETCGTFGAGLQVALRGADVVVRAGEVEDLDARLDALTAP